MPLIYDINKIKYFIEHIFHAYYYYWFENTSEINASLPFHIIIPSSILEKIFFLRMTYALPTRDTQQHEHFHYLTITRCQFKFPSTDSHVLEYKNIAQQTTTLIQDIWPFLQLGTAESLWASPTVSTPYVSRKSYKLCVLLGEFRFWFHTRCEVESGHCCLACKCAGLQCVIFLHCIILNSSLFVSVWCS